MAVVLHEYEKDSVVVAHHRVKDLVRMVDHGVRMDLVTVVDQGVRMGLVRVVHHGVRMGLVTVVHRQDKKCSVTGGTLQRKEGLGAYGTP